MLFDNWFWTSGKRAAGEQDWKWTTNGNNVTYTAWNSGEPSLDDAFFSEACMNFRASVGGWDDDFCTLALSYVCENIPV